MVSELLVSVFSFENKSFSQRAVTLFVQLNTISLQTENLTALLTEGITGVRARNLKMSFPKFSLRGQCII